MHAADVMPDWVPSSELMRYARPDCDDVCYVPGYLNASTASGYCTQLATKTQWLEESIKLFGRSVAVPRRCAWSGDAGISYGYSGQHHRANGWTPATAALRDDLCRRLGVRFNFVLMNQYRDGNDCIGWHSDNERDLGKRPCIASLSFGAPRRFCLRARVQTNRRADIWLESGSLLLMWGRSQQDWMHSLPRTRTGVAARVNLTFRLVRTHL